MDTISKTLTELIIIGLSIVMTFGLIYFIYPEYILGNIIVHFILLAYYVMALQQSKLILGFHLIYSILIAIFLLLISNNLKVGEIFTGQIKYSLENNTNLIVKDLINRKIYKEENGLIIGNEGFNLLKGINFIDIIGLEEYTGMYGNITLSHVLTIHDGLETTGRCISKNFIMDRDRYPRCKKICSEVSNCNNISWNVNNKSCELFSACTKYNRDKKYKSLSLEKKLKNLLENNKLLTRGNYIISQDGSYILIIEESGELKLYDSPSSNDSIIIENIIMNTDNKTKAIGAFLHMDQKTGVLRWIDNNMKIIWESDNRPGINNNLILLNRGLLVMYDVSTDNIIWTSNNDWRENNTLEDIRKEIIKETQASIKYQYNLKTRKLTKNKSLVEHRGEITLYNKNGIKEIGHIKLYTSTINNQNYMNILGTNVEGKYLIK